MEILKKRKSHAFGKDIYLLGKLKNGELIWLEEAEFSCGWYWGFGYTKTYANNKNPEDWRDITGSSHFDELCLTKPEYYDTEKQCFRQRDWCHILKDNPDILETPLNESEQWELSDLMKTFYTLKEAAEIFCSGNSHYTGDGKLNLKDEKENKRINEEILPRIFKRLYEILSPPEVN